MDRFPSLIIIAGGPVFNFWIKFWIKIVKTGKKGF
jgi:hypothetical protein